MNCTMMHRSMNIKCCVGCKVIPILSVSIWIHCSITVVELEGKLHNFCWWLLWQYPPLFTALSRFSVFNYFFKGWSSVWSILCKNFGMALRWIRWHVREIVGVCWQGCVAAASGPSWGNVSYLNSLINDCKKVLFILMILMHSTILKSFVLESSQEDYVVQMCESCTLRLRLKKFTQYNQEMHRLE